MVDPRAHVTLQRFACRYLGELAPELTRGRYYMQFLVRCYVVMGPDITTAELLRQASERYSRSVGSIRACVGHFTKNICKGEFKDLIIHRWKSLGWDGVTELTPAVAIPLVCRGFQPFMENHYPREFRAMMTTLLPYVAHPEQYLERPRPTGEEPVFDTVDALFKYLEEQ